MLSLFSYAVIGLCVLSDIAGMVVACRATMKKSASGVPIVTGIIASSALTALFMYEELTVADFKASLMGYWLWHVAAHFGAPLTCWLVVRHKASPGDD